MKINKFFRLLAVAFCVCILSTAFSACERIPNNSKTYTTNSDGYQIIDATETFTSSSVNHGATPWDCSLIEVNDGWIATGTDLYGTFGESGSGFIAKFDKTGKKLWARYLYANKTGSLNSIISVMEIADGYLFSVDFIYEDESNKDDWRNSGYSRNNYLIKYSKSGDLIWIKDFGLQDAVPNNEGFIGIINRTQDIKDNNVFIVQYDTDGNVLWRKNLVDKLNPVQVKEAEDDTVYTASTVSLVRIFSIPNNGGFIIRGILTHYYKYNTPQYDMWWGDKIEYYNYYDSLFFTLTATGEVVAQNNDQDLPEWDYSEIIVTENRVVALGLRSVKIYDFELNLVNETIFGIAENHYWGNNTGSTNKKANKIGENYFTTGYYSDGNASCFVYGFNSYGEVVWDMSRESEPYGVGLNYYGAVETVDGMAVLAGYRYYGNPATIGPHKIDLHFLFYNMVTKTFTQGDSLL